MTTSMPAGLPEQMRAIVRDLALDLRGRIVLTEAATGPYAVTAPLAALAGARVLAFCRDSRHGTAAQARRETLELARRLDVAGALGMPEHLGPADIAAADLVTNSGHLRPLNRAMIEAMKPEAVISLMYESWELRSEDIDMEACRARGIRVCGTNECHPRLRVFHDLGALALLGLRRGGVTGPPGRLLLVCDNPFGPFIARTLLEQGARVTVFGTPQGYEPHPRLCLAAPPAGAYDAVILAHRPGPQPVLGHAGSSLHDVKKLGSFPVLVQIWGDVDRTALSNVVCEPPRDPPRGHMGILLSELGYEPVVRLQAGGLKAGAEVLAGNIPAAPGARFSQPVPAEAREK